jgi:hypothetical protein
MFVSVWGELKNAVMIFFTALGLLSYYNDCFTLYQFVECTFGSEHLAKIGKQPLAQLVGRSYNKPTLNMFCTLTEVLILNQPF